MARRSVDHDAPPAGYSNTVHEAHSDAADRDQPISILEAEASRAIAGEANQLAGEIEQAWTDQTLPRLAAKLDPAALLQHEYRLARTRRHVEECGQNLAAAEDMPKPTSYATTPSRVPGRHSEPRRLPPYRLSSICSRSKPAGQPSPALARPLCGPQGDRRRPSWRSVRLARRSGRTAAFCHLWWVLNAGGVTTRAQFRATLVLHQ